MTRTLHAYLARDLVRVTLLALAAFTLILTILTIIEPLRQQGLSPRQAGMLIVYTLPVMLSFSMPVASLFAATIVYGRFSQDRELLACRASGISTPSVLVPGLLLAAIVTAAAMLLSNFVAPRMSGLAERKIKANIEGMVYSRLRTRGYLQGSPARGEQLTLRARPDSEANVLRDVVAVYRRGEDAQPAVISVESARPHFFTDEYGTHYLAVDVIGVSGTAGPRHGRAARQSIPPVELPNPMEDKPRFYTLDKLRRGVSNPTIISAVARKLAEVRRLIAHDLFCARIAEELSTGNSWRFTAHGRTYVLRAPSARPTGRGSVELRGNDTQPVCVSFVAADPERPAWAEQASMAAVGGFGGALAARSTWQAVLPKAATADVGHIETDYDPRTNRSRASIVLTEAAVRAVGGTRLTGREEWRVYDALPAAPLRRAERIPLAQLLDANSGITRNEHIRSRIASLDREIARQRADLIAELNLRLSYGASCFLLVAFGAALGVIFHGGQLLSAFVLSLIPGGVVFVMILMGKEMARHPDVPLLLGVGVVWAGVVALLVGCIWVYVHLARH